MTMFASYVGIAVAVVSMGAAPDRTDVRQRSCKIPTSATILARSSRAVVFEWKSGQPGNESTTLYGCRRRTGRKVRLWRCDAGQLTSETLQSVRLKNRSAILEIERKPEERETYFHLTRRVNLVTGKRRDSRSDSRPQPSGTDPILLC
jgi:hypothetical protein